MREFVGFTTKKDPQKTKQHLGGEYAYRTGEVGQEGVLETRSMRGWRNAETAIPFKREKTREKPDTKVKNCR